jgi:uncharacterized protein
MPADSLQQLPILLAIIFVASLIQGATGFGFGLFAVAALSLFVQLKVTTPLVALLNLPVILYVFWRLHRAVVWRGLAPVIVAMLVGIPFGIFVLVTWPQDVLLRILGVVLIAASVRSAWPSRSNDCAEPPPGQSRTLATLTALVVGWATGALSGAFNAGGPPIVAYVYCRPGTKEQRTATLQAVFGISVIARIIVMAAPPASLYHAPVLLTALACLPACIGGTLLGHFVFRRIPPRALEVFVSVFLFGIGLKSLIWP